MTRYVYDRGLTPRPVPVDALFAPEAEQAMAHAGETGG
jgi:hypothetical protein